MLQFEPIDAGKRVTIFTGNYGSGKTEVAVNFALALARAGQGVSIADLDIVNPYFRCREASEILEAQGVEVVAPAGALRYADLPIILPRVKGMIEGHRGRTVLDVGGDPVGAKVLGSFSGSFDAGEMDLLVVLNANRPFTDTLEGCVSMIDGIEEAARLGMTGIAGNTHLLDETGEETVLAGERLAREVGGRRGLPIRFVTVEAGLADRWKGPEPLGAVFRIERLMLPPWIQRQRRPGPLFRQG